MNQVNNVYLDSKKYQFLVIDGDERFLDNTKTMLNDMGHSVYVVKSGEDAYRVCRTKSFDVILTTLFLPGEWNGPQTAVKIRKDSRSKFAKIVGVTEKDITQDLVKICVKAGMKDCIPKGFDVDVIRKRLPKWTAKAKTDALNSQ